VGSPGRSVSDHAHPAPGTAGTRGEDRTGSGDGAAARSARCLGGGIDDGGQDPKGSEGAARDFLREEWPTQNIGPGAVVSLGEEICQTPTTANGQVFTVNGTWGPPGNRTMVEVLRIAAAACLGRRGAPGSNRDASAYTPRARTDCERRRTKRLVQLLDD
jgi:hypothetical protein